MKSPVLLAVMGEAADFDALFEAARARGLRVGWLELESAAVPPPALAGPTLTGAFRAVAVGSLTSIAVKPMKGAPVLRDLLREHFLGADIVLVRGLELLPKLSRAGDVWKLVEAEGRGLRLSTTELLDRCRKPDLRWREREPVQS